MKSVVVRSGEGYRVEAEVRDHTIVFDEPTDLGGSNAGGTPVEGVLAALGGCTVITLKMVAARKTWPLTGVTIRIEGSPPKPGDKSGQWAIVQHVHLEGPLEEAQHARLMDIAGRCPVHRMLEHGATFQELAWDGQA